MNITLRQLEVFCAVADHGSVTRAGEFLGLTQSAVSASLAQLERQLGGPLFDRRGRTLRINERGRVLLPEARRVLAQVSDLVNLLSPDGGDLVGALRVGSSTTIGNYVMPFWIAAFRRLHPRVTIQQIVANGHAIETAVLEGMLDLGFIEGPPRAGGAEVEPWLPDELVVFAGPTHPLAGAEVTPEALVSPGWIMREHGSGTRQVFERALREWVPEFEIALELGHTEAIKRAVEAGLGIGCLSRLAVERELQQGWLAPVHAPFLDLRRQFLLIQRRGRHVTRVLGAFREFLRNGAPEAPPDTKLRSKTSGPLSRSPG
ncbi:LysR family transcriptional regulator [Deferrisoma camini]|uniref:LysR family transcriptional regulator n=1 Tax=Deferrisoma camini TaxID=1035120 RepID=UPI00046CF741|nr:LysR family transcriptional regulator [Deferrisoma camini]